MTFPWRIYAKEYIAHLEGALTLWRTMWEVERQRANLAMDRLLADKHVMPITGPLFPDRPAPPDPADLEERLEQAMAGEIGVFRP